MNAANAASTLDMPIRVAYCDSVSWRVTINVIRKAGSEQRRRQRDCCRRLTLILLTANSLQCRGNVLGAYHRIPRMFMTHGAAV